MFTLNKPKVVDESEKHMPSKHVAIFLYDFLRKIANMCLMAINLNQRFDDDNVLVVIFSFQMDNLNSDYQVIIRLLSTANW